MSEIKIIGKGVVAPKAPKVILPHQEEISILIESMDPENGYSDDGEPIPSEHMMAKIVYPDGISKHHQVTDIADLLSRITTHIQNRLNIRAFRFEKAPSTLEAGSVILKEIVYDA
jgi:hypothetical protein